MKLVLAPEIRDNDLLVELERLPKGSFYEFQVRELEKKQAKRDSLNAMAPGRRRREQTAEQLALTNPTQNDLRHIHSVLAICGLPYDRLPTEQREFERKRASHPTLTMGYADFAA